MYTRYCKMEEIVQRESGSGPGERKEGKRKEYKIVKTVTLLAS